MKITLDKLTEEGFTDSIIRDSSGNSMVQKVEGDNLIVYNISNPEDCKEYYNGNKSFLVDYFELNYLGD